MSDTEFTRTYAYAGKGRDQILPFVRRDELEAIQALGGQVDRTTKLINGNADVQVTWRLKAE